MFMGIKFLNYGFWKIWGKNVILNKLWIFGKKCEKWEKFNWKEKEMKCF